MATPEQIQQVKELEVKIEELKVKVNNFIFWQRVRFLIGVFVGSLVGSVVGGLFFRWLNG